MTAGRSITLLLMIITCVMAPVHRAIADPPPIIGGEGGDDGFVIVGEAAQEGEEIIGVVVGGSPFIEYKWASPCAPNPDVPPENLTCGAAMTCGDAAQRRWVLWGRTADGQWRVLRTQCFGGVPPEYVPPEVTPDHVLTALRQIGLPALQTHTQPEEKTLVNFDTIFYTDPQTVDLNLTILGQAVHVIATPSSYRWVFGDGQSVTTTVPGDPYPAKTIVHRYQDAHVTVQPHVAVSYSARFQVGSQPWQDIDETVTITGPPTDLRIAEATAVLSGNHD